MIERQPYLPRFMAGGPGQSDGRARALSRRHGLSHPRHQPAADDRPRGVVRLLPPGQPRRDRSVRAGSGRHQGRRAAGSRCSRRQCAGRTAFRGDDSMSIATSALSASLRGASVAAAMTRRRRRSRRSRSAARCSAASARACSASPLQCDRASGPASMSISAARWRLPSSTMPSKVKFVPLSAERPLRCAAGEADRPACRATRPGRCRARPSSASIFAA